MNDTDDLVVDIGAGQAQEPVWKLRFWNRGLDQDLVTAILEALLDRGFPLDTLIDPEGFGHLLSWLNSDGNRDAVVEAYRAAIRAHQPQWEGETSGGKLANFLSLGLYAGPVWRLNRGDFSYSRFGVVRDRPRCCFWDPRPDAIPGPGWMGTGDAPLGEQGAWDDFALHFGRELLQVGTVLLPHHGAAPRRGPRFFNPGLIPEEGTVSVISVGTRNNHGHPMPDVIAGVLQRHGDLQVVTEENQWGLQEVIRW